MANTIGTAYIQIVPSTEGISGSITSALSGEATSAGKSAGTSFSSAFGTATKVAAGTAVAFGTAVVGAGTALANAAANTAEYGDNIDKMSQKLGVSSTFYQEWEAVLEHSGTSMESMKTTFKTLSNAVQDGSTDQQEAFQKLGLSMEDLQSLSTEEVFTKVISGLQGMEEGTERTAIASDLLGRGATELGALLNTSTEDTQAMIDAVNDLGGVMSEEGVKASAAYQDSLQDMQTAFAGLKNSAMSDLLPGITTVMDGISALVSGQEGADEMLSSGVQSIADSIASAMPTLIESISTISQALLEVAPELLSTLAQGILTALPNMIPTLVQVVSQIAQMIIDNLPLLLEAAGQVVLQLASGIGESLPTLIPAIIQMIVSIVQYLLENIDLLIEASYQLVGGLAMGLIQAIPVIAQAIPQLIASLISCLVQAVPKLIECGKQFVSSIITGWNGMSGQMLPVIQNTLENIRNKALEIAKRFLDVGKNIIEGIKQGIENAWDSLVSWFSDKISGLVDMVEGVLKIGSPSKVFANEVGQWIPAGISQGIEAGMGDLDKTVEDMALSTVNGAIDTSLAVEHSYNAMNTQTAQGSSSSDILNMMSQFLPYLQNTGNVNVTLQGDAGGIFKVVKQQNKQYIKQTGSSAFA